MAVQCQPSEWIDYFVISKYQTIKAYFVWFIFNPHSFTVGSITTNEPIVGKKNFHRSVSVPTHSGNHPRDRLHHFFTSPNASASKVDDINAFFFDVGVI